MTELASPRALPRRARRRPEAVADVWAVDRQDGAAPAWWRGAIVLTGLLSVVIVVGLWARDNDLAGSETTVAAVLTSFGRLCGLVASDLLLIQVLLMARVPGIERSFGQDVLARVHRRVGKTSFWMMVLHIALIVAGYSAFARTGPAAVVWDLLRHWPGMALAFAGTALLFLVVGTSIRAARRKLQYESWHLIHIYAYVGAGLVLPHQIWVGAAFVAPDAKLYWWTVWGATAASVLIFRVVTPLWRSLRHGLVVVRVDREYDDIVSVYMRGRNLDRLGAKAGHFFQWRFGQGQGWTRAHPYSLSAAPRSDMFRVSIKAVGDGGAHAATLRPGTRVFVEGPYGRLTREVRVGRKVTLMASGIGITPMRALLEALDYEPGEATLLYRARDERALVFRAELDELAMTRGANVIYLTGGRVKSRNSWLPASAEHYTDAEGLAGLVPDIVEHDVYMCGPNDWMDAARAAALACGLPARQVHLERFDW